MKILFLCDLFPGNPFYRDRRPALENLKQKGFSITLKDIYELLDDGHYKKNGTVIMAQKFIESKGRRAAVKRLTAYIQSGNYTHVVLANSGNARFFLNVEFFFELRKHGIKSSVFLGDDEFDLKHNYVHAYYCDLPVVYLTQIGEKYRKYFGIETYLMPNGVTDENYSASSLQKPNQVVFYGSNFGPRESMIEHLLKNGIAVTCYGKGWNTLTHYPNHTNGGFLEAENFYSQLSQYRIHLCLLEDHLSGKVHWTTKVPDAAKMNAFPVITDHQDGFASSHFDLLTEDVDYAKYQAGDKTSLLDAVQRSLKVDGPGKLRTHYQTQLNYNDLYRQFFNVFDQTSIKKNKRAFKILQPRDKDWALSSWRSGALKLLDKLPEGKAYGIYSSIPK